MRMAVVASINVSSHPKVDPSPLGLSLLSARQTALALTRHLEGSPIEEILAPVPTMIDRARLELRDRVLDDLLATGRRETPIYSKTDRLFGRTGLPTAAMNVDTRSLPNLMDDVREALSILGRYQGDFDHGHHLRHSRIHLRKVLAACEQAEEILSSEAS